MTSLVIAEHDNNAIKGATLNTVTAAAQCGGDVHVLVAGSNAAAAAAAAAQIAGVSKVIHADEAGLAHGLAENVTANSSDEGVGRPTTGGSATLTAPQGFDDWLKFNRLVHFFIHPASFCRRCVRRDCRSHRDE